MTFKEWIFSKEFKEIYKSMPKEIRDSIRHQIPRCGSIGSGNHFCEIQCDEDNNIWFMIHCGSRKLGHTVASYYHEKALSLNDIWISKIPNKDCAFLPINTNEGKFYLNAMNLCLKFVKYNHEKIQGIVKNCIESVIRPFSSDLQIFIHHNYARWERHYGRDVLVHRKGATSARKDELGIIPGSQGSNSYIVKGLGNPKSFMSCSHGAGRQMSRTDAKKNLNLEEQINLLNNKGIRHSLTCVQDLEEAEGAYKDIDTVMKNQEDLVEIVVKLRPLIAIKELSEEKEIKNE